MTEKLQENKKRFLSTEQRTILDIIWVYAYLYNQDLNFSKSKSGIIWSVLTLSGIMPSIGISTYSENIVHTRYMWPAFHYIQWWDKYPVSVWQNLPLWAQKTDWSSVRLAHTWDSTVLSSAGHTSVFINGNFNLHRKAVRKTYYKKMIKKKWKNITNT